MGNTLCKILKLVIITKNNKKMETINNSTAKLELEPSPLPNFYDPERYFDFSPGCYLTNYLITLANWYFAYHFYKKIPNLTNRNLENHREYLKSQSQSHFDDNNN